MRMGYVTVCLSFRLAILSHDHCLLEGQISSSNAQFVLIDYLSEHDGLCLSALIDSGCTASVAILFGLDLCPDRSRSGHFAIRSLFTDTRHNALSTLIDAMPGLNNIIRKFM